MKDESDADLINKMEGGLQELDETTYWLELLGSHHHYKTPKEYNGSTCGQ